MVLFTLIVAGLLVPTFWLVEERENKILEAVLVTPIRFSEVLTAKAGIGLILTVLMALVTQFLSGAPGSYSSTFILALIIAALTAVEFGLM